MTPQSYNTKIRRYRIKKKAVELLGGKCIKCGWNGCIAGFCFHHTDPSKKEFGLSSAKTTSWEKFKKELDKCELFCLICHGILHSDYDDPQFLKDVEKYEGRELEVSKKLWKNQNDPNNIKPKKKRDSLEISYLKKRKVIRPSKEELIKLLQINPVLQITKDFGLKSQTSIYKWCKSYGIDPKQISPFSRSK